MNFAELKELILADYNRYHHIRGGILHLVTTLPEFQIVFWFRIISYLQSNKVTTYLLYPFFIIPYRYISHFFGVSLPCNTRIMGGVVLSHAFNIVINQHVKIGENCTIMQGVTIGSGKSNNNGIPTIGNNVIICAGAIIIGNVKIGDNSVIGAGAVVVHDVPAGAVVAGNPAKIISHKGREISTGYIKI